MIYNELLAQGRAMPQPMLEANLRGLLRDDRFAAVLGWLDRNREAFVKELSKPAASENAGRLAHAAGAVHCINSLSAQLARLDLPATAGGMQPPANQED